MILYYLYSSFPPQVYVLSLPWNVRIIVLILSSLNRFFFSFFFCFCCLLYYRRYSLSGGYYRVDLSSLVFYTYFSGQFFYDLLVTPTETFPKFQSPTSFGSLEVLSKKTPVFVTIQITYILKKGPKRVSTGESSFVSHVWIVLLLVKDLVYPVPLPSSPIYKVKSPKRGQ